jgi:transposase
MTSAKPPIRKLRARQTFLSLLGRSPAAINCTRRFVVLCRTMGLFAEAGVAIDGSKFKAVNRVCNSVAATNACLTLSCAPPSWQ